MFLKRWQHYRLFCLLLFVVNVLAVIFKAKNKMAQTSKWGMWLKNVTKNLLYSVPVVVVFLDNVGYVAKVEGISMQPALNPEEQKTNDYVLLNKWAMRKFQVQHGDIVALTCPRDPDQKLIKRVIALEGDTVKAANKLRYVSVPVGHCWVEGENLNHSMDSNFFGPVAVGLIIAKASHIVWPPSRWQKLDSQLPSNRRPLRWPGSGLE